MSARSLQRLSVERESDPLRSSPTTQPLRSTWHMLPLSGHHLERVQRCLRVREEKRNKYYFKYGSFTFTRVKTVNTGSRPARSKRHASRSRHRPALFPEPALPHAHRLAVQTPEEERARPCPAPCPCSSWAGTLVAEAARPILVSMLGPLVGGRPAHLQQVDPSHPCDQHHRSNAALL